MEARPTRTNDSKVVADFVQSNIFSRFGMPRVIISDGGSHFCNRTIEALFKKYGVSHRVSTPTIPKPVGKQRFQIVRSSAFWKKRLTLTERIGAQGWWMRYGHIGQLTRPPLGCPHIDLSIEKRAIYRWNWSTRRGGS